MPSSTRVFISATTGDLGSIRQLAKEALLSMDCHPVEQTNFPPDYRTVREILKEKISGCQAVIHIVGQRYGAEPNPAKLPNGASRRSYTQIEYDLAKQLNKKVYVFLCPNSFPFNDCEPESDEKQRLQQAHRNQLSAGDQIWTKVTGSDELAVRIRELQLELDELRDRVQRSTIGVFAGAAFLVFLLCGLIYGISRLGGDVVDLESTVVAGAQQTAEEIRKLYEDPDVLVGKLKSNIRKRADDQIANAKSVEANWRRIQEIEKERDSALDRVDDLVVTIREGLSGEPDPIFSEAARLLAEEGVEEAITFLESKQPETLDEVDLLLQRQAEDETRKRKLLARILLKADLHKTNLEYDKSRELYKTVASKASQWSRARWAFGLLLIELAEFEAAEPHLIAAQEFAEGDDERFVAANCLGTLYLVQARYGEAEPLIRRALAINEQIVGSEHPNVAKGLSNLGLLLMRTNRLAEAEPMMRRAMAIDEKVYGAEDPKVARDLNNLGQLLKETNQLAEAEPMMRRAMAIDEKVYGAEHPNVARDLSNLAQLLQETNQLAEVEQMIRRAMAIDERFYGNEHPNYAIRLNNLAAFLLSKNRLVEAEPMMRRALAIHEKSYGPKHPRVASDLNNLAQLLKNTSRVVEAGYLMRRALAIDEQSSGGEHPDFARDLNNLAQLLQDTNRLVEAEQLMRRAFAIFEQSYGAKHPNVAVNLNNLALLMETTSRLAEAESLLCRALAIDERSYGADHPKVAIRLSGLAILLKATKRLAEAEPLMRRALAIDEKFYGPNHSIIARHLYQLSGLLQTTNRLPESESLIRHALAIDEQFHGTEHITVASDLIRLATLLKATNRLTEAERLWRRALAIVIAEQKSSTREHPLFSPLRLNYIKMLQSMNLSEEEISHRLQNVKNVNGPLESIEPEVERLLGPTQPVADILAALDSQYESEGRPQFYFLKPDQPMSPHLVELLKPTPLSLNARGVRAYHNDAYAESIVQYDEALKISANNPRNVSVLFRTRTNRAAALRDLGEVSQARDELDLLLSGLDENDASLYLLKGRAYYHRALCEWRLGDSEAASRDAEKSMQVYGDDARAATVKQQTERLLEELRDGKPIPPLVEGDTTAALESARVRFRATENLKRLSLDQPAAPLLDKMLGPVQATEEVFAAFDRQYRDQGRPEVWFLPLDEPISLHLDELLGKVRE
ncbi:MAG: tetratricopeptide repeat protein [Planctomycetota bacterium]